MKTKLQIIGFALSGFILTSCSSSMYLSKTSVTPTDDIYYTPSKTTSLVTTSDNNNVNLSVKENIQDNSSSKYAQLEKKYAKTNPSDTIKSDSLARKDENPYERVLSDSYQESYERRLRGYEPHNRMDDYGVYYSKDYWYASTFDPYFYNTVVEGDQVWVEPWYISSMFLWPHTHFSFGFGFGWNYWGYSPWYSDYYYSPYYWYSPWNYNPYPYGYWNHNYYDNDLHGNKSNDHYYGRRYGNTTNITTPNRRPVISYENQIISSRRSNGATTTNFSRNRNSNQTFTPTRQGNNNQEVIRRGNRNLDMNTTRLSTDGTTRNINMTESTRRSNNNIYQRPRSSNNDDYIRTSSRNQNTFSGSNRRDVNTRDLPTIRNNRNSTPTYNSPNRVNSSTTRERTNSTGYSGHESSGTRSSGNSSSGSVSGSRSSGNSGSGSHQSSSSGGNGGRTRR